jgi:hypothetical protein
MCVSLSPSIPFMPRRSEAVLDIEQPAATPMINTSIVIAEYLMVSSFGHTPIRV